jgi:DNA-binding beta-propeller fold protein YncE
MTRPIASRAIALTLAVLVVGLGPGQAQEAEAPVFEVDPFWPRPLPNDWAFGQFAGVAVDSRDHVWILQRPDSLADDEIFLTTDPPTAECCRPAPPVMEFDQDGEFIQAWGGPGTGYDWPDSEHGIHVDATDNVWIGGNGPEDTHLLKFTRTGAFVLHIGSKGTTAGSNDTENLNRPSQVKVNPRTDEVFVADGYGNRRIVVFDATTGAYKRHWGAYGNLPDDQAPRPIVSDGPGPPQFNLLHGLAVAHDDTVYVADRVNNRIQAFQADGTFLREGFIARRTLGSGSTFGVDLSADPEQRFLYVPDGANNHIWILDRDTLRILGRFGSQGRYAGQFYRAEAVAVDTMGNLYVAETEGKRVQRFLFKGMSSAQPTP